MILKVKLSNKRILQIFSHCINKNRTKLTIYNYQEEIIDKLNAIPNLEIRFECFCGASKLVFCPEDKENNFVIKIPFTGTEEFQDYFPFQWDDEGITWYPGNYCDIEAERCKKIIKAGFGDFIAKTVLIGIVGDLFIYKQELVDTVIGEGLASDETSLNYLPSFYNCHSEPINSYWVTQMKNYAGQDKTIAFLKFLEDNGFNGDIHGGNCGFKNGVPKIFDYSDFFS